MTSIQFDLIEGRRRKVRGMRDADDHALPWSEIAAIHAEQFILTRKPGDEFQGEDMRSHVLLKIGEGPRHPNAWGAVLGHVLRRFQKSAQIEMTGFRPVRDVRSHARLMPVYRVR